VTFHPDFLEAFQEAYLDSIGTQLLASLVVLAALAAAGGLIQRAGRPLKKRYSSRLTEATQAGTVAVLTVLAVLALTSIWEVAFVAEFVAEQLAVDRITAARGLLSGTIVVVAYLLIRLVNRSIDRLAEEHGAITSHQSEVAYHVADVAVFVLAFFAVLAAWGVDPGRLFVGAGVLGAVLGFAARGTLSAITAGFVLLFSRPFRVGDWIEVEEYEGIVRDVTIVNTKIRTFDDEHVLIPNDHITNSPFVNRSRNDRLRIDVEVATDYGADLDRAIEAAENAMEGPEETLDTPSPRVVLRRFADSGIVLELRFWIDKPSSRRKWKAQTGVIRSVKAAFDREGITIPFPQRTLSAREKTGFGIDDGRPVSEPSEAGRKSGDSGTPTATTDGGE
jgi:small-conductance mechanosensitive channel